MTDSNTDTSQTSSISVSSIFSPIRNNLTASSLSISWDIEKWLLGYNSLKPMTDKDLASHSVRDKQGGAEQEPKMAEADKLVKTDDIQFQSEMGSKDLANLNLMSTPTRDAPLPKFAPLGL